eukprot:GHVP01035503.1.p2 GENE.GHVP01035503.1~~GHVP01035503.1.p2  ORF type:complete len:187 (-),score=31.38 GHVP01035503.1:97-657(-)
MEQKLVLTKSEGETLGRLHTILESLIASGERLRFQTHEKLFWQSVVGDFMSLYATLKLTRSLSRPAFNNWSLLPDTTPLTIEAIKHLSLLFDTKIPETDFLNFNNEESTEVMSAENTRDARTRIVQLNQELEEAADLVRQSDVQRNKPKIFDIEKEGPKKDVVMERQKDILVSMLKQLHVGTSLEF